MKEYNFNEIVKQPLADKIEVKITKALKEKIQIYLNQGMNNKQIAEIMSDRESIISEQFIEELIKNIKADNESFLY